MPANAWVSARRYLCYMIAYQINYMEVTIRGGKPKRSENNKGGGQTPRRLPECALLPCIFVRPKTVLFALKRVVLQSASR